MALKDGALAIGAIVAASLSILIHAAPAERGGDLVVDITNPAPGSRQPWNSQISYSVTASYDGKSTKFGEIPANDVVARASYVPDADAASAGRVAALPDALVRISQSNCMGCHDFTASSSGPSFAAIGKRYEGRASAQALLALHIRLGSSGVWGTSKMPPHPELSTADSNALAQWILKSSNDPSTHYSVGRSGSFKMAPVGKPGPRSGIALAAFYTGPLKASDTRASTGRNLVIVRGSGH